MKFIILDLEWNTAIDRKIGRAVNEIIEIGAVKLDERLCEIDRFSCMVVSQLTDRLSGRFKNLTGITNDDMLGGLPFSEAIVRYEKWAGNALTMTWSNSDIFALYDNYSIFLGQNRVSCISKYMDLQKYTQRVLSDAGVKITNQISLSAAADMLGINYSDLGLHRAFDDCELGAMILKSVYDKELIKKYTVDTEKKDYYKRLTFKPHIICDINSPKINKKAMNFKCDDCGRKAERISQWRFRGRSFRADFHCKKCNTYFLGCVSFKNCFDKVTVKKYKIKKSESGNPTKQVTERDAALCDSE